MATQTNSEFHPGSTRPIMTAWTEPPDDTIVGWVATFMLRAHDTDAEPVLTVDADLSVVAVADLDAEVAAQFTVDEVWQARVVAASEDTQELRGVYAAGLDLTATGQNVPLLDHHRVLFTEDIARDGEP